MGTGPVRIGLLVNPNAGLGGRVGLKGTDGAEVLALARLYAEAPEGSFMLVVAPGAMGEEPARVAGLEPATVIGEVGEATAACRSS